MAKRVEGEMEVLGCVDQEDEGREVDKEARLLHAKEVTGQTWNVEDIVDQETLAAEGKDGCATTQHWNVGVVPILTDRPDMDL